MNKIINADICVIGGGSGGLSVAAGAQQMGADTVLIEKGKMGGDCLNYGCVPSKSLLAAGRIAHAARVASYFGITVGKPQIDTAKIFGHVQNAISHIEPHDSVTRFEALGVTVVKGSARFIAPTQVEVNGICVKARRIVIATGSSAFIPPIRGLDSVPYLTNETIFHRKTLPDHLVIIGGGPIGVEMAQAHRRLGCKVTVLEGQILMPKDDPELVEVVRAHLSEEGIKIHEGVMVEEVNKIRNGIRISAKRNNAVFSVVGSHILIATGRKANVEDLNLEKAKIEYTPKGIQVDARLRTSNKKAFAIGDVIGGYQFTHVASYHASIVIKNILFRIPAKANYHAVPWVTYTNPELANVGLTEKAALQRYGDGLRILRRYFSDNDRAVAENETHGFVKVLTTKRGKLLGAAVVGPHAGELIQVWCLALSRGLKVGTIATMIAPYPTFGEINKQVAGSFYTSSLFSEKTRKFVRFLAHFG